MGECDGFTTSNNLRQMNDKFRFTKREGQSALQKVHCPLDNRKPKTE